MRLKNRIDRLSKAIDFHMPDDDEIVVIRLTWPEQDRIRPIVKHGNEGGKVTVRWPDDAAGVA